MRDTTGIQVRRTNDGVERCRGRVKERGKWVNGPWGTYADAKAWRARAISTRLDGGTLIRPQGQTIAEAGDRFLVGIASGSILSRKDVPYAASTARDYEYAFRCWIVPELGHIQITQLRRSQVQRWADWVASRSGAGTTRNVFHALAALYSYLLPRHDELGDPTDGVKIPRAGKPRQRYASPEEMRELLAALPPALALPYALAFYAGLRRGEIQALRVSDVEGQWVHVRRSLDRVAGFVPPKNGHPRQVPLFAPLRPYVASLTGELVVPSRVGSRYGSRDLSHLANLCEPYWRAAGLERIGLHEGRHSFATALVRAGYDIALVSEWVGHGDAGTTLRIYVKPRGREHGLTEKMDTYLAGGPLMDPLRAPMRQDPDSSRRDSGGTGVVTSPW